MHLLIATPLWSGKLPRILLVEDDLDVRFVIEHVLVDDGHEVDTSATTSGGIDLLRHRHYDLVIADAKLPDGTGMDVCDAGAERRIRCIIITGYAFTLPVATAERYEVLLKPLRPAEIITAVEKALHD